MVPSVTVTQSSHLRSAFVIAFPVRQQWLASYTQDLGIRTSSELAGAKLFFARARAEYTANLFHGQVREVLVNADGSNPRLCAKHLSQIDKHKPQYSGDRTEVESAL